jgi:DNA-binding response OmpR family regulator
MSRAMELLVDRVLEQRPSVLPGRSPPVRARDLAPFSTDAGDCTCLLVGMHGDLARRLMADFPTYGVRPVLVTDAEAITRFVRTWKFDAVLVDAREPDASRPVLLDTLAALPATPLLLLSATTDERDIIVTLERGAVDILPPQASSRLIATKIKRLARIACEASQRRGPELGPPRQLKVGSLLLDLRNEQASVNGARLELPGRAFAVLAVLAQHVDMVLDRTTLSLHLGSTGVLHSRAFDMQISHIRAALCEARADVVINTVYRRGYRLELRALTLPARDPQVAGDSVRTSRT